MGRKSICVGYLPPADGRFSCPGCCRFPFGWQWSFAPVVLDTVSGEGVRSSIVSFHESQSRP